MDKRDYIKETYAVKEHHMSNKDLIFSGDDLVELLEHYNSQPSPLISNGATQEEQARKILQGYKCSSHSDQNFIEESVIEAMLEYASLYASQVAAKQRNESH